MSALLLLMCGVEQDAVVEDYVQSEANLKVRFPALPSLV
jgi:Tyrosine phosphatase family